MPRSLELIIFDLDGTLVDAYPAIVESFNYTMKKMGLPGQDKETIRRAVGWGRNNLLKPFVGRARLGRALSIYRPHHRRALLGKTKFLPGAKRVLTYLKSEGYKLAVASNRPKESAFVIFRHLRMRGYFDDILCGDQIKKPKPSGDMLKKILKKFSLSPRQALYVGDMTVDILTGRKAGVKTVAVTTGSSTREEMEALRPFKILNRISQLKDVVLQKLN